LLIIDDFYFCLVLKTENGKTVMKQRGRKSPEQQAIVVDGTPPRLTAPAGLTEAEQTLFTTLVNACDPRHFIEGDSPILVSFVQATLMVRTLAGDANRINEWDKVVRAQMALARSLRLTVHTRLDPETVARASSFDDGRRPWQPKPEPWE
jgi:hypothetical protein